LLFFLDGKKYIDKVSIINPEAATYRAQTDEGAAAHRDADRTSPYQRY
jgi:hypothetical protein